MATTRTRRTAQGRSSAAGDKDLVTRLADAGEEALQRLADLPGGQRALNAMNDLRSRVDDLAKKVRGIDALEERVSKLEKRVADLEPKSASRSRSTAKRDSS